MSQPYAQYTAAADRLLSGGYDKFPTKAEQYTAAIYSLLSDGKWHTARQIMVHLGLCSKRHIHNIMQSLRSPLGIVSSSKGYRLNQEVKHERN